VIWFAEPSEIVAAEQREVEVVVDEYGFANKKVPESADIVALGDSFTKGIEVLIDERWISIASETAGLTIYNMGEGGFGPSQEVLLYKRYRRAVRHRCVLLGIYGINDVGDEENFARFLESGMSPKEWAYYRAGAAYPSGTFDLRCLLCTRGTRDHGPQPALGIQKPADEIQPISVLPKPSHRVGYHPFLCARSYRLAHGDPSSMPGVQRIITAIGDLSRLCNETGHKLIVMYFPAKHTIHPPEPADQPQWLEFVRTTAPEARETSISTDEILELGHTLLRGDIALENCVSFACDAQAIPFLSLRPHLLACARNNEELLYYHFDCHMNAAGHRCAGPAIAHWVRKHVDFG
jgi:hypothetical protein